MPLGFILYGEEINVSVSLAYPNVIDILTIHTLVGKHDALYTYTGCQRTIWRYF